MPGHAICPYCRATVQPLVGPDGQNVCPRCNNLGPAGGQPVGPPPVVRPTVPGAVASLVLGIVGVLTGLIGIVLGIIAIVMARDAKRLLDAAPGAYEGEGMVTAGRILGIVAIVMGAVSLLFAVFVFGLVNALD